MDLPFLQEFVESALANGARPYVQENERLDMSSGMSSFVGGNRSQQEPSHALRFEAYETPTLPTPNSAPPALLPDFQEKKPESPRSLRNQLAADNMRTERVDLLGPEVSRLRLDGVQKKWGRPSTSSQSSAAASNLDFEKEQGSNGYSERANSHKDSSTSTGQLHQIVKIIKQIALFFKYFSWVFNDGWFSDAVLVCIAFSVNDGTPLQVITSRFLLLFGSLL